MRRRLKPASVRAAQIGKQYCPDATGQPHETTKLGATARISTVAGTIERR